MGFILLRWVITTTVALLAVSIGWFHLELMRLYRVQTLFDASSIAENFRSTHDMGFPYNVISTKGAPVASFYADVISVDLSDDTGHLNLKLPNTFQWNETTFDLQDWLDLHWTTGLVVLKRDATTKARLLYENYGRGNDAASRCVSWSVCKSFVSAAFGIAVKHGFIGDIEVETVTDYVPELVGSGYEGVRLKDVLQMSSGIAFNEDYFDPLSDINWMGYTLALGWSMDSFVALLDRGREPGTYNHYVSMDTQVLAMVLVRATKQSLSSFLEQHLWSKVGFEADATLLMDNAVDQAELAFGILGATTRDYARFGWLYLNGGLSPATGEEVVPKAWVEASLTADSAHLMPGKQNLMSDYSAFGYGFQWWLAPDPADASAVAADFMAIGVYNQFIYVSPEHNVVIAKNSAFPYYADEQTDDHANLGELQALEAFRAIATAFRDA